MQGGSLGIDVSNLNVSAGVRINDRLGIGGTLTLSRLDFRSDVSSYVVDTSGSIIGEPVVEPTLDLQTVVDDTDDDVVYSLGILYKQTKWQLGAVYRHGPDFTVTEKIVSTLFQRPGEVHRVEEPKEGYFPDAGFTIIVAGKAAATNYDAKKD